MSERGRTYGGALFDTVSHVMKAERILKETGISYKIIPVRKIVNSDCGLCVPFLQDEREAIIAAFRSHVHIRELRDLLLN